MVNEEREQLLLPLLIYTPVIVRCYEKIGFFAVMSSDLPRYSISIKFSIKSISSCVGVYYLENLDYCWIFYQYDDYSNKPDMAQFSPKEFEMYFKNTRAHIMN